MSPSLAHLVTGPRLAGAALASVAVGMLASLTPATFESTAPTALASAATALPPAALGLAAAAPTQPGDDPSTAVVPSASSVFSAPDTSVAGEPAPSF